jgi:hypothetical protein
LLLRTRGLFEAIAEGRGYPLAGRDGAEDDVDAGSVEGAKAGEETLGEAGLVVPGAPGEDLSTGEGRPVIREEDAQLAGYGVSISCVYEALAHRGLDVADGVEEEEAGAGSVVADADAGGG